MAEAFKILAQNRKARHDYFIEETYECGIELKGTEVKSIRQGSVNLKDVSLEKGRKYAIVLGHEVFGVQQNVVDMTDGCIEIPQYGTKHSLNVSVTAGIVMYELSEKLRS